MPRAKFDPRTWVSSDDPLEPVIVMQRTFDAPRELVWAALTDPAQVAKWYGGRGFESPVCEMNVRPRGRWRHVMRTPDGAEHALEFVFVEVVAPEKLSWRNAGRGPRSLQGPHDALMTVTLEEAGSRTKWTLTARFGSTDDRDAALGIGFATIVCEGAEKLDEALALLAAVGA